MWGWQFHTTTSPLPHLYHKHSRCLHMEEREWSECQTFHWAQQYYPIPLQPWRSPQDATSSLIHHQARPSRINFQSFYIASLHLQICFQASVHRYKLQTNSHPGQSLNPYTLAETGSWPSLASLTFRPVFKNLRTFRDTMRFRLQDSPLDLDLDWPLHTQNSSPCSWGTSKLI